MRKTDNAIYDEIAEMIDNRAGNTMATAVNIALSGGAEQARIATAFLTASGLSLIAASLEGVAQVRLLIGSDPAAGAEKWRRAADEYPQRFVRSALEASRRRQVADLRNECDRMPFTRESRQSLRGLARLLGASNIEIRRYDKAFMHAKAYIVTPSRADASPKPVIVGSSNLTSAGMQSNLELSLVRDDTDTAEKAVAWFDELWAEASPFQLAEVLGDFFAPRDPYIIFLRILFELYGKETEEDTKSFEKLRLTEFQRHGVLRALRLIEACGGAIVADEVGLGKTFIAGEIIGQYQMRRQRALVICPASLINTWESFQNKQIQYIETISFDKLANDVQLCAGRIGAKEHLAQKIGEYQLVVVDEAHNYRNPDAPTRAQILRALLYGQKKDLLLLTATPVNNSLWDLYHLISYFIRQDAFLADKGILSIRKSFADAERKKYGELSPDELYPIVDATTVKRTRDFISKHYPRERIKLPDGKEQRIIFPQPHAITVKYDLDNLMPGIFGEIAQYLDPESSDSMQFARYMVDEFRKDIVGIEDSIKASMRGTGFLWSGMIKRFESSSSAFAITLDKMIGQHEAFLQYLDLGHVVTTKFLQEYTLSDDGDEFEVLRDSEMSEPADLFNVDRLSAAVNADLTKLKSMRSTIWHVSAENDPKLSKLIHVLKFIVQQANEDSSTIVDETDKRKVLIFSSYADTVQWIYQHLCDAVNPAKGGHTELEIYKDKIGMVYGGGDGVHGERDTAAQKFAPRTMGSDRKNQYDVLVTTDVLAEGVNLQQARHVINFDMPWNPMRLVQRHGRIDRLLSNHKHVYLRTFFPEGRLDEFLGLDYKVRSKIARAAATVGVVSPIEAAEGGDQVYTETREELRQLEAGDAAIFERGGTKSAIQSGEEYRQTLREALKQGVKRITELPWKSGSGMRRGREQGILFCAKVCARNADRTYLRFVHADSDWQPIRNAAGDLRIETELGRCLRICECSEEELPHLPDAASEAAFDLWPYARDNMFQHWTWETDPANLQPDIRKLNRQVAEHIRNNIPLDAKQEQIQLAIDIVQAPWSRREENRLRAVLRDSAHTGSRLTEELVDFILKTGLEPLQLPNRLAPIDKERIDLLVWMAITAEQD